LALGQSQKYKARHQRIRSPEERFNPVLLKMRERERERESLRGRERGREREESRERKREGRGQGERSMKRTVVKAHTARGPAQAKFRRGIRRMFYSD